MALKLIPLNMDVMKKMGMVRRQRTRFVLIGQIEEESATHADVPMGEVV